MVPYIAIDIVIVLVIAFFAWRGAKKGLILTLFGMLGLIVALFGARLVSNLFCDAIAEIIRPGICQALKNLEQDAMYSIGYDLNLDPSVESMVAVLRERNIFPQLVSLLETSLSKETISSAVGTAAEVLAGHLARLAARVVLFVAAFLVILLVWFLISHMLDLTFRLPILSTVNLIGGLVFGLLKAVIIIVVLVWFGQLFALIPADPTTPILSLFTPERIFGLLNKLVA